MKRILALAVACAAVALVSAGCGNDSGVSAATPTPTTPTPTPTSTSGVATYNLAVSPNPATCDGGATFGTVSETFSVSQVPINITASAFTPQWNLSTVTVMAAPSGTLTGDAFSATWSWCAFDGAFTIAHVWTWTGTLSTDHTTFTSTATETLTSAAGNTSCAAANQAMNLCSSTGATFSINGTKQ